MSWKIKKSRKENFKKTVFIEGLPGIGNVGKIAADILIQEFKAKKVADFFSYNLPNAVFVREDNLVNLPKIEVFHFKHKKRDFLFLLGDVQPTENEASYEFTETVLNYAISQGCEEIITLGGIGLQSPPKNPDVYCSANDKSLLDELSRQGANSNTYGKVGPIMGISGLLLGMGAKKKIKAAALLGETMAHPMYIGLKGSKRIMEILNVRYKFDVSTKEIEKEIKEMENKIKQSISDTNALKSAEGHPEISYIG